MEAQRWERIQTVFYEIASYPESEWQRLLAAKCEGEETKAEILGMLRRDRDAGCLLNDGIKTLANQTFAASADWMPLSEFGPYRLTGEKLGDGGMGSVWLAERKDALNFVAVKFLKVANPCRTRPEELTREIQTLASLNHPFIAALYDAGALPDGTGWFAMEYVKGRPVDEYCKIQNSSLEARVRLFRFICEAVAHAHSRAVIHLDLKPANILIREDGTPKLLDFGIAKQLESRDQPVRQTHIICTPEFAAPEQMLGQPVGTYTDIYALGLVLYKLLAGKPAYNLTGCTPGQAEVLITSCDPERPSASPNRVAASKGEWKDLGCTLPPGHKQEQRWKIPVSSGID